MDTGEEKSVPGSSEKTEHEPSIDEEIESKLCEKCGVNQIDYSESANSVLCRTCRDEQIKFPIPKPIVLFLLFVIIITIFSYVKFPESMKDYKTYVTAPQQAQSGNPGETADSLFNLLEKYPDSEKIATSLIEICTAYGYFDNASYVIDTYLAGKDVDNDTYYRVNKCVDRINQYYNTLNAMDELIKTIPSETDSDKILSKIKEELEAYLSDPSHDKALLYLFLSYYAQSVDEAMEYCEASISAEPIYLDAMTNLGHYKRRKGDLEGAEQMYQTALRRESNDAGAYRGLAVLAMLRNDAKNGLQLAQKAYDLYPDEEYALDTLAIAFLENGLKDEAEELIDTAKAKGQDLDEQFYAFLRGEISLEDYYIGE